MNQDKLRQFLIIVAVVATIVVNGLANALPINGQATGEISDRFEVFFVPAGYVFSIWGLIYLGLAAYAIYQALPAQAANRDLRGIGGLFLLSSIANIGWILLWHYEYFALTVIVMLALLAALIAIFQRLQVGLKSVARGMKWNVHIPFSIYLGWITVATIANITAYLDFIRWDGWGIAAETWTIIMLSAAVLIGTVISITRRNIPYAAVLIWAFAGIAIKHQATAIVANAAWAATAAIALNVLWIIVTTWQRGRNNNSGRTPAVEIAG